MLSADCLPTVAVLLRLQPSAPPPLPNPAVQFNGDDYWRKALTWSRGKFSQLRLFLFWSVARHSLLVSLLHKFEFSLSQHLRIVPQLLLSHSYFSQFSCTSSFCVPSREKDAGAMCSGWIWSGSLFLKDAAGKRKERRWQSYVKSKQHAWMTRDKNTRMKLNMENDQSLQSVWLWFKLVWSRWTLHGMVMICSNDKAKRKQDRGDKRLREGILVLATSLDDNNNR